MTKTEIPSGDSGEQTPPETNPTSVKSGSDAKVTKASTCERVWLWVLLAVVIIVAIGGLVATLVLESRKRARMQKNKNHHGHHEYYDDYHHHEYYDDEYHGYDDYFDVDDDAWGTAIETNPFEVDVSHFSADAAESYASIEDLRADIELLGKVFANRIILGEANKRVHNKGNRYYDDWGPFFEADVAMASPTEGDMAKDSGTPENFFRGMDDFETYQHEVGAVKDDLVKSDGVYVYACVDDRIERWDLEGNLLRSIKITSGHSWGGSVYASALLMNPEGTRLVVIGSDTGGYSSYDDIMDQKGQTLVSVFDIEGGSFTELSKKNIDGYPNTSYIVGNNVHIVTKSSLSTWGLFDDHLHLHNFYDIKSNEEYVVAAKAAAEKKIIPSFVKRMVDLVSSGDEIYLSPIVGYPDGYKSLTQVHSFDISEIATTNALDVNMSKSLVLGPGHTGYVYATGGWLWVSDETWAWGRGSLASSTETTLLGFRLDGASTSFAATTTIPGELLSQFSIDFVEDNGKEYVRVAITQNSFDSMWWEPRPFVMSEVDEAEDEAEDESESSTLNEIIIFEIPSAESDSFQMTRLGSVEVGKKDETITAARFFGNLSYIVTFERTDPFYVLDLSDPENPTVLGELEVPGFSEFMHPITADNSMLITVGKDANEFGAVTGFQVSIFDSSTPTDPKLLDRLVIEGGSSSASWDERAFRYIQVGDVGRLIVPLYQYDNDRFGNYVNTMDGFSVFGVDLSKTEEMITRELDINHHVEHKKDYYGHRDCYCRHIWLPQRSLVFDGNLMTMKNSLVASTDLGSGETLWNMTLEEDQDCCHN